jgi:hypothetical protein
MAERITALSFHYCRPEEARQLQQWVTEGFVTGAFTTARALLGKLTWLEID